MNSDVLSNPDARVTLAHGNGGRLMRELIDGIFAPVFGDALDTHVDAALLPLDGDTVDWLITTDGFTVEPLEFPGGDISNSHFGRITRFPAMPGGVRSFVA